MMTEKSKERQTSCAVKLGQDVLDDGVLERTATFLAVTTAVLKAEVGRQGKSDRQTAASKKKKVSENTGRKAREKAYKHWKAMLTVAPLWKRGPSVEGKRKAARMERH
jgi:hypothetical protein